MVMVSLHGLVRYELDHLQLVQSSASQSCFVVYNCEIVTVYKEIFHTNRDHNYENECKVRDHNSRI